MEADIAKLLELDNLVRAGPKPPSVNSGKFRTTAKPKEALDELAFIKSVTDDDKSNTPSPKRASGAQYQPNIPMTSSKPTPPPPNPALPTPPADEDVEDPRPLKCRDCGTMNLPTEWYCEQCGAELAAV